MIHSQVSRLTQRRMMSEQEQEQEQEHSGLSRRRFAGALGAGVVAGATGGVGSTRPAEATERAFAPKQGRRRHRQPNLLVILGDDMGWADLSSYGAPDIRTPNLDAIAASGIRFTD